MKNWYWIMMANEKKVRSFSQNGQDRGQDFEQLILNQNSIEPFFFWREILMWSKRTHLDSRTRLIERQAKMRETKRKTRMYNSTVTGRKEVMNYAWESVAPIQITVSSRLPCGALNLLKPFEIITQPHPSIYEPECIIIAK